MLLLWHKLYVRSPVEAFCMTKEGPMSVHHAAMEPHRDNLGIRDNRAQRSNHESLAML